ncbi:ion channel [Pendulispora albinea]|uniref:Potassium channel family protein n=1 Tax=Pendulispora albinea TaxID=2741071 RepID=A0ABZ2M2L6_9BACT
MTTEALFPIGETHQAVTALSPAEELATFTAWATAIFYLAEVDKNPKVRTYFDAYHYIATSLSVGYANVFPVTQVGKMVGAVVMMVGPSLSARALDSGAPVAPESSGAAREQAAGFGEASSALVAKLDEILVELRRANGRSSKEA